MNNKFLHVVVIWIAIVIAYLGIAVTMPAGREMVNEATTQLNASANMSQFPGTQEFVESSPVWIWILPGLIGAIVTAVILKRRKNY